MGDKQEDLTMYFEKLYKAGVTPWKDHPPEPSLSRFLSFLKERMPRAKILDAGCGDGWISVMAAKRSFRVWGIDGSATAIERARSAAAEGKVVRKTDFRVGDILDLPYGNGSFDAVIDRGLFHHILVKNRARYKEGVLRVMKEKAYVHLSVFSRRNRMGIGNMFTKEEIASIFGPELRSIGVSEDEPGTRAPAHLLHFILERRS